MMQAEWNDRVELSRFVMRTLQGWGAEPEEQVRLLGLPADTKPRHLRRYFEETALPENAEINERIEHVLGIADALRTSYPTNARAGAMWMNQVNYRFDDRSPLSAMIEDGIGGFIAVRAFIDCAWDWNTSGSKLPGAAG